MSKVNSIPSTICLNSKKDNTSGQEEKMIGLKTKERMIDLTSANKNKTASWTDSHIQKQSNLTPSAAGVASSTRRYISG